MKYAFQNDMAQGNFKGLHKRTASGKVLCNKCTIKNDFMSSQQLAKE